ncbi:MAG: type II secretion system F family protein [Erysipelotrichaceae bacterium]|nr:type II secretion system F family protein [Erysipelotrichaceae bacterium]
MGYLKVLLYEKCLSIDDLTYLSKLLETNLPMHQCFDLLRNKRNQHAFNQISQRLKEGELIEQFISEFVPRKIRSYLIALLPNLSFSLALSLSLRFYEKEENSSNTLLSQIAYPCILFFVTISALYLFDLYGMDSMFDLLGSFASETGFYQDLRYLFRIAINIIYYAFLIGVLLYIYFRQPKRITYLYLLVSKHFPNSLFNIYCCEEFMSLFLICLEQGYKTKDALNILKNMKSKPLVSFLAFHLDDRLMQGASFKEAASGDYYDASLARYIKIGNFTNDFAGIISSYVNVSGIKIQRKMKEYALLIQMSTYFFIGAIIIFIYQLLFMPMQAIIMY